MNQALLSGIASKAYDKLLKAAESKQPIAVTGLPDTMAAYIASKLCADTGKKVLLISGNDLKAAHDAEDGQQLLETGVACLPGGEIDLTRGASSHESAWRRLEALARAQEGDIRLLCTSMDAALQRMGSADRFREETIRLAPGDRIDLNDLIRRLTAMGYERVSMVEGKGQCACAAASSTCIRRRAARVCALSSSTTRWTPSANLTASASAALIRWRNARSRPRRRYCFQR